MTSATAKTTTRDAPGHQVHSHHARPNATRLMPASPSLPWAGGIGRSLCTISNATTYITTPNPPAAAKMMKAERTAAAEKP